MACFGVIGGKSGDTCSMETKKTTPKDGLIKIYWTITLSLALLQRFSSGVRPTELAIR